MVRGATFVNAILFEAFSPTQSSKEISIICMMSDNLIGTIAPRAMGSGSSAEKYSLCPRKLGYVALTGFGVSERGDDIIG